MRTPVSWTRATAVLIPVLSAVLLALLLANVSCSGSARKAGIQKEPPAAKVLPSYAYRSPEILLAYKTALRLPEVLEDIPCLCGCMEAGHRGLKDCFIAPDGAFDDHGADCDICYEEAVDVGTWFDEGVSLDEIQDRIFHKYGDRL